MRFAVHVHPAARSTRVGGRHGPVEAPALVVRVAAPAVDGRANVAVIAALAAAMGVRKSAIRILVGANRRTKIVEVDGLDPLALEALMEEEAPPP